MGEYGQVVSRGFDNLAFAVGDVGASVGRLIGDAIASADQAIHQVVPAAIPSWAVLVAVVLVAAWFLFRR